MLGRMGKGIYPILLFQQESVTLPNTLQKVCGSNGLADSLEPLTNDILSLGPHHFLASLQHNLVGKQS
jgi:hypothetical protein